MPLQADQRLAKTIYQNPIHDPASASQRWWLADPEKQHQHIWAVCDDILTNLSIRRRMNYFFQALYNDTGAAFMASRNMNLYYNRTALDGNAMLSSRMTINVLQNCIDTAASIIAKNKPKPQILTDGSKDYDTKQRGKKLTKYLEGVYDQMGVYQLSKQFFLDAAIIGTGVFKVFAENGKLKLERIFIEEMLIDDTEGMHEKPQQIHQRKYIPRDVMAAQFQNDKEKLAKIQTCAQVSGGTATFSTADIIPVIESWHLPSGPKAKDGRHAISIENCTLLSEPYKKDYFPFIFFRWAHQTLGFWGRGICHEIWKLQRELDGISQTIQQAYRLASGAILAVEAGSAIPEAHLRSNKLFKIVEYSINKPEYLCPPLIQPEIYEYQQYLEDRMYKITGISQASATGTKPPDVKSGAAIREVDDIAQGRLETISQDFEQCIAVDLARIVLDISADLQRDGEELSIITASSTGAERISFADVMTDLEDCVLQVFPVSGLSTTPAGRLDQLMDYAQAGYLSKEQVMDVVDFPDLEDTVSLETASLHLIQDILSQIKEGKEYIPPSAYLTLPLAYRMVCLEVDRSQLQKVSPENVQRLRDWADECKALMDQATSQAAQAQQQAGPANQQQMGTAAQAPVQGQAPPQAA